MSRLMTVDIIRKDGSEERRHFPDVYDIGHMNDGTLNCFRTSRMIDDVPERDYWPLDKYEIVLTENELRQGG
jgi:hypothetical protein